MKIGEIVNQKSLAEYKKLQQLATKSINAYNDIYSMLIKAKGILDAPITKSNLQNATEIMENMPDSGNMQKFVIRHILKSAKKPNAYCKMVKDRCKKENRYYQGYNSYYFSFNHLSYQFVFKIFKEAAIRENPTLFSLRFRDALIAFILNQRKYTNMNRGGL